MTTTDAPATDVDDRLIPEIGVIPQVIRMFRVRWVSALFRTPAGVPVHPPEFVASLGRAVRLIDIREPDELTGPLGHVPGSVWVPRDRVHTLLDRLHRDAPVVLISRGGERASEAALALEKKGMRMVSAMYGGIVGWRQLGFAVSRDAEILARRDVLPELTDARALPVTPMAAGHYSNEAAPARGGDKGPKRLTAEEISGHMGETGQLRWIKMAALLLHGRLSCVDGRDDAGVIGTPGGDAGEWMLTLGALERVTGRELTAAQVETLLARRVDTFGRFYVHTDVASSNAFIKSLRGDPRLNDALSKVWNPMEWREFLSSPPESARPVLLEHIAKPDFMGCGHLKRMMLNPETYGVRTELTQQFVRTFFELRWQGAAEMDFVPLGGGHSEAAVANVRIEGELQPFSMVPLVSPTVGTEQLFVNHPQVSTYLREQTVYFLAQQGDVIELPAGGVDALCDAINEMAGVHLGTTLGFLAKGLPVYDITFGREGEVRVEHTGDVG